MMEEIKFEYEHDDDWRDLDLVGVWRDGKCFFPVADDYSGWPVIFWALVESREGAMLFVDAWEELGCPEDFMVRSGSGVLVVHAYSYQVSVSLDKVKQ